jgi:HAD superfamily hydrolase (TIGR01509 family)
VRVVGGWGSADLADRVIVNDLQITRKAAQSKFMATPPAELRALILDLFGVIVTFDDHLVYDRIAQRCANPPSAAVSMINLVSDPNLICGRTSLQQIHAHLAETLKLNVPFDEFEAMWLVSYSEAMPGIRDLLRQLNGKCKLVLLSNVDPFYWPAIESSIPELQSFHAKVLSFQEGVAKPDADSFKRAVAASETPIEHCYFVDDKPENIDAAASIGLAGHAFTNCRTLKAVLRSAGLLVA